MNQVTIELDQIQIGSLASHSMYFYGYNSCMGTTGWSDSVNRDRTPNYRCLVKFVKISDECMLLDLITQACADRVAEYKAKVNQ